MNNALIVSVSEKANNFLSGALNQISCSNVTVAKSCHEAKNVFEKQDFDICIINCPTSDGLGEKLAIEIATKSSSQVIIMVKAEFFDKVSEKVEDYGVMTVSKPINKTLFYSALKLAKSSYKRMQILQTENTKLTRRLDDIKTVDRAKYILITYLSMSEPEAHKYIEKQAMDTRSSKRKVAERILKTYEN